MRRIRAGGSLSNPLCRTQKRQRVATNGFGSGNAECSDWGDSVQLPRRRSCTGCAVRSAQCVSIYARRPALRRVLFSEAAEHRTVGHSLSHALDDKVDARQRHRNRAIRIAFEIPALASPGSAGEGQLPLSQCTPNPVTWGRRLVALSPTSKSVMATPGVLRAAPALVPMAAGRCRTYSDCVAPSRPSHFSFKESRSSFQSVLSGSGSLVRRRLRPEPVRRRAGHEGCLAASQLTKWWPQPTLSQQPTVRPCFP